MGCGPAACLGLTMIVYSFTPSRIGIIVSCMTKSSADVGMRSGNDLPSAAYAAGKAANSIQSAAVTNVLSIIQRTHLDLETRASTGEQSSLCCYRDRPAGLRWNTSA